MERGVCHCGLIPILRVSWLKALHLVRNEDTGVNPKNRILDMII